MKGKYRLKNGNVEIEIKYHKDWMQIGTAPKVSRPVYISRSRWIEHWRYFCMGKITDGKLIATQKFLAPRERK